MLAKLFHRKPPLDETSAQWLFEVFAWALRNFDASVFRNETILVVPSNEHFPGRAESVHGMAALIFGQVLGYAGMQHWPYRLNEPGLCQLLPPPKIEIQGALRGSAGVPVPELNDSNSLAASYDPALVSNPEALIAGFAHTLAQHLGSTAREAPPGGEENWPQITEVLAVFMGFGLMFANSAFNLRSRSCGSCAQPADRQSYLSQYDVTYALALFTVLKEIPEKQVARHLKSSLKGFFKQAIKDIRSRREALDVLSAIA